MSKNYSTTVSLSPSESDRWQFVFASQAYGTFYGIYALFTTREVYVSEGSTDVDPTKVGVERIEFELINYKGPVDLSLMNVSVTPPNYEQEGAAEGTPMIVEVELQANIGEETKTDAENPVNLVVQHGTRLEVNRVLRSLGGMTKGELDARVQELDASLANGTISPEDYNKAINELSFKGGVFDEEYFFRNGKLQPKLRQDGDFAYTPADVQDAETLNLMAAGSHLGYWCIGTRSKLLTH